MGPAEPTTSASRFQSYAVSKLTRDGSNWIMWKSQTLATLVASHGVICHIDSTAQAPPPVSVFPSNCPLTDDEEEWLEKAEKHHDN